MTVTDGNLQIHLQVGRESVRQNISRASQERLRGVFAWTQEFGKGRVFYTALGHRDEVWRDPRFQTHLIGGLRYILRLPEAGASAQ